MPTEWIGVRGDSVVSETAPSILMLATFGMEMVECGGTLAKHVDLLRRAYGRDIGLELEGRPAPPPAAATEVLRIAQEALQNALRHSRSERLTVRLEAHDGALVLSVADEGEGFDSEAPAVRSHRLGLTSMEERARALGGSLAVVSRPGEGTTVTLEVPR